MIYKCLFRSFSTSRRKRAVVGTALHSIRQHLVHDLGQSIAYLREGYRPDLADELLGALTAIREEATQSLANKREQARKRELEAVEAMNAKNWAQAVQLYDTAYSLYPVTDYLYTRAVAFERWPKQCRRAIDAWDRFLEVCRSCPDRQAVEDRRYLQFLSCPDAPDRPSSSRRVIREKLKTQTFIGYAPVGEDRKAARRRAVDNALDYALKHAVDVHVGSLIPGSGQSVIRDKGEWFEQDYASRINARRSRFVSALKVLDGRVVGGVYEARIRVAVNQAELLDEFSQIVDQLARAGYPKLMFIVEEYYTGSNGEEEAVREPALLSSAEEALFGSRIRLGGQRASRKDAKRRVR